MNSLITQIACQQQKCHQHPGIPGSSLAFSILVSLQIPTCTTISIKLMEIKSRLRHVFKEVLCNLWGCKQNSQNNFFFLLKKRERVARAIRVHASEREESQSISKAHLGEASVLRKGSQQKFQWHRQLQEMPRKVAGLTLPCKGNSPWCIFLKSFDFSLTALTYWKITQTLFIPG